MSAVSYGKSRPWVSVANINKSVVVNKMPVPRVFVHAIPRQLRLSVKISRSKDSISKSVFIHSVDRM